MYTYDTSIEMLRLRSSLFNIQYFLMHSPPGIDRTLVDQAIAKLYARMDELDPLRPA